MLISAFCERPFNRIKVTSEGSVSSCCWQYNGTLGNILKQPFDEIWNSNVAEQIRNSTLEGKLHSLCLVSNCPYKFKKIESLVHKFPASDFPSAIEIDLPNTHCNIGAAIPTADDPACIMCPRSSTKFKPQVDLLNKVLKRLRPLMPYFEKIHIQGIAEPFFKERFFEVIEILEFSKYKSKCEISVITNGTLFSERLQKKYIDECPISLTLFSVDAASPKTYVKVRRINAFDFVKKSIKSFVGIRNKATQEVVITNNINMLNIGEVELMVELAAECGVDKVEFNATDKVCGPIDEMVINKERAPLFREAQEKIEQKAKDLNIKVQFVKNLYLTYDDEELVEISL